MDSVQVFGGAKVALLTGNKVLVYQRDDRPTIPFPGQWDLPGGGREGNETPMACLRERDCRDSVRDEGEQWTLMDIETFTGHRDAVSHLQARLEDYLREHAGTKGQVT